MTLSSADFLLRGANLAERKITFQVTEHLPPGQGFLERVDKPREQLKVFTLDDLNTKRITYQAPTEKELGSIQDENGVIFSFTFNGKVQLVPCLFTRLVTVIRCFRAKLSAKYCPQQFSCFEGSQRNGPKTRFFSE